MTVGELINALSIYDKNTDVYLRVQGDAHMHTDDLEKVYAESNKMFDCVYLSNEVL